MIRDWSHTRTLWKRSFMGTCNLYAALMGHRESRSQYVGTPHPDLSPLGTVQLFVSTPSSAVSLLLALNQCVESSYDLWPQLQQQVGTSDPWNRGLDLLHIVSREHPLSAPQATKPPTRWICGNGKRMRRTNIQVSKRTTRPCAVLVGTTRPCVVLVGTTILDEKKIPLCFSTTVQLHLMLFNKVCDI